MTVLFYTQVVQCLWSCIHFFTFRKIVVFLEIICFEQQVNSVVLSLNCICVYQYCSELQYNIVQPCSFIVFLFYTYSFPDLTNFTQVKSGEFVCLQVILQCTFLQADVVKVKRKLLFLGLLSSINTLTNAHHQYNCHFT